MARRRTKKEKIAYQKRIQDKEEIQKLENEKQEYINKQDELDLELKKNRKVRNVKIFKSLFKLSYPYVIAMVGVQLPIFLFQGGLPFKIDSHNCYKAKTLETTYDGHVSYLEEYVTNLWWEDNTYPNELKVTTPWELCEDGTKKRFIREYDITYSDEIADAILDGNYTSLEDLLGTCSSEISETTNDENISDNSYHFEGTLGTLDLDSSYKVPESKETNDIITSIEVSLFTLISILILKWRKFRLTKYVKEVNGEYNKQKMNYKVHKEEIDRKINEIDKKILSIKK